MSEAQPLLWFWPPAFRHRLSCHTFMDGLLGTGWGKQREEQLTVKEEDRCME